MLIIDGAEALDYESCKNINSIKKTGTYGKVNNTPEGMETGSLSCIMNILGVPKQCIPTGRAYLEAVSEGIDIDSEDLIFRCNNVTIKNNKLISSCGKYEKINLKGLDIPQCRLIHMDAYKNLLVMKNTKRYKDSINTYPPHQNIGRSIEEIYPSCSNKMIEKTLKRLIDDYSLFPWGQSIKENIPSFRKIHNKDGAVVCKTEIVKGIAKAMKMYCPDINESTADIDTNLLEKAKKAIDLSKEYEFVLLHINGADESAHRKNYQQKIEFINKIDSQVVSYILENITTDTAFIVTSDHGTSAESGKHVNGLVNYYILNENEEARVWLKQ